MILLLLISAPAVLPVVPMITAVTLAELSAGLLLVSDANERARRQAHLQQAEADFEALEFDQAAARAFGRVANDLGSVCRPGFCLP